MVLTIEHHLVSNTVHSRREGQRRLTKPVLLCTLMVKETPYLFKVPRTVSAGNRFYSQHVNNGLPSLHSSVEFILRCSALELLVSGRFDDLTNFGCLVRNKRGNGIKGWLMKLQK